MARDITIVDIGRGPQLSTCRITVLDLVPYFQRNSDYADIVRWMPNLSREEVEAAERFYRGHKEEFDQRDRLARERREEQIEAQRLRFPEMNGTPEERRARLKGLLEKRRQENGR